jgi:uncharacterized protein with GYD domain
MSLAFTTINGKSRGFYIFVATTFALALGSLGNVKTTTLRAYTKEEFAAMVKKLP